MSNDKRKLSDMQPMEYLDDEEKTSQMHTLRRYGLYIAVSIVAFIALIATYINFPRLTPAALSSTRSNDLSINNRTLGVSSMVDYSTRDLLLISTKFQKIFVLNMQTRVDQKDILTVVASVMDLDFHFWMASTPDSIPDKALPDGAETFSGGPRGEWISQMSIYQ